MTFPTTVILWEVTLFNMSLYEQWTLFNMSLGEKWHFLT